MISNISVSETMSPWHFQVVEGNKYILASNAIRYLMFIRLQLKMATSPANTSQCAEIVNIV